MKKNFLKKALILFFLLFSTTQIIAQKKCRTIISNEYDADTDIEYTKLIGGIIFNDGAKALLTDFQDIIALYAGKSSEGELLIYLQHTRYVNSDNSTSRENLSIKKDNKLTIIGDFGKIQLTAYKDQNPSTDVKGLTKQTKNKICQVYLIDKENLDKLCSGIIKTLVINYNTAPKLIKKIKPKNAEKHLKLWACSPKELN